MIAWKTARVEVEGVSLAVHRVGRGAPVVCLTAIGHDVHDFDLLAEHISDRYELIAVEWPGHGQSDADAAPASAARYAGLLTGCLDQLALDRPILIGNSIGGAASIIHASRRPVKALVLCSSGGLVKITPLVRWVTGLHRAFFSAGERGAWWYGPGFWLMYRTILTERPAVGQRRKIVAGGRVRARIFREAWTSFGEPSADLREMAAKIDVPIWAAWASKDRTVPLSFCLPAIKRFKHGVLSKFKCGHAPFLEQPDAFAREFLGFAERLAAGPRISGSDPLSLAR